MPTFGSGPGIRFPKRRAPNIRHDEQLPIDLERSTRPPRPTTSASNQQENEASRSGSDPIVYHQLSTKYTPRRQNARNASTGSTVQPGVRLTREQHINAQRERQSSRIKSYQELFVKDDLTFRGLWEKIKNDLGTSFQASDDGWSCYIVHNGLAHARKLEETPPPSCLHSLLITYILFLLVFGALNCLTNHLLSISRASAQCSPLISYVPVTYTATSYVTPTSSITPVDKQDSASTETLTSTSTHTKTVLLSQVSAVTTSQYNGGSYYYAVESGTTSWLSNISPSAGVPQVTLTTTIYVTPGSTGIPTTTLEPITVLPPPYVSTTYSLDAPGSTHTVTYTQTQTQTVFDTITRTRSSFMPPGTDGWNSTATSLNSDSTSLVSGIPTTITGAIYWSTGTRITSTSLTTLTLTLTRAHQSTITITDSQSGSSLPTAETPPTVMPSVNSQPVSVLSITFGPVTPGSSISSNGGFTSSQGTSIAAAGSEGLSPSISNAAFSTTTSSYQSPVTVSSSPSPLTLQPPAPFETPSAISSSASYTQGGVTTLEQSSSGSYVVSTSTGSGASPSASSALASTLSSPGLTSSDSGKVTASSQSFSSSQVSYSGFTSRGVDGPSQSDSYLSSSSLPQPASSNVSSALAQSSGAASATQSRSTTATSSNTSATASPGSSLILSSVSSASSFSSIGGPSITSPPASSSASTSTPVSSMAVSSQASASQAISSQPSSLTSYLPSLTTASISTVGNATSSASPLPSVCGEHGNFTLDFDDLPMFSPNGTIDITQAAPIFNGYHHLAFSNGYVYAPPPSDPYPPHSSPHLAVFLGNASGNGSTNTPSAMAPISGMIGPGEFGDGSSSAVSAFWFDAYSAWLGCDNPGPEPCTYTLTAYVWDPVARGEKQVDKQTLTTPACPGFQDCHLQEVQFPQTFVNLTGLQIQAYKGPDQVMFFMDDVQLAWSNNTCAAGLRRAQSPRGAPPSKRTRR